MVKNKNWLEETSLILILIGALNLGIMAIWKNVISLIFVNMSVIIKTVYGLIGLSASYYGYLKYYKKSISISKES